jgi:hypothetical protein
MSVWTRIIGLGRDLLGWCRDNGVGQSGLMEDGTLIDQIWRYVLLKHVCALFS